MTRAHRIVIPTLISLAIIGLATLFLPSREEQLDRAIEKEVDRYKTLTSLGINDIYAYQMAEPEYAWKHLTLARNLYLDATKTKNRSRKQELLDKSRDALDKAKGRNDSMSVAEASYLKEIGAAESGFIQLQKNIDKLTKLINVAEEMRIDPHSAEMIVAKRNLRNAKIEYHGALVARKKDDLHELYHCSNEGNSIIELYMPDLQEVIKKRRQ